MKPVFEPTTLAAVEREHILMTLWHAHGNRTHAVRKLDISIRTLRNKLIQYEAQGYKVAAPGLGRPSVTEESSANLEVDWHDCIRENRGASGETDHKPSKDPAHPFLHL